MPGLPPDLYNQCCRVLRDCSEFESYRALRAVFVTEQLRPFRIGLRSADSPAALVDQCLDYLLGKSLSGGYRTYLGAKEKIMEESPFTKLWLSE